MVDSICTHYNKSNEETSFWKFWIVFAVNGGLSVFWRDPKFAKIFGTKVPSKVPTMSYVFWMSRDCVHIIGSAVIPDYMEKEYGLTKDQWRMAQLLCPLLIQTVTTPLNLFGLDYYNNSEDRFNARWKRVRSKWIPTMFIRMLRMFPPWSVGLIANREIKNYLTQQLENT